MRRRRLLLVLAGVVVFLAASPLPAAAQRVQSSVVLVRADDVITEDLYAAGNSIVVSGRIEGDLVAVAFDSIRIDGVVEGDVVAVSSTVEITGRVDGAVRVAAGSVSIGGEVGDDLFAAGLSVDATSEAVIGRDALVWARAAELSADIGRNVEGVLRSLGLGGAVGGDVDVTASGLVLLPGLIVDGDVRYTSESEAVVAETATVGGTLVRVEALPPNLRVRAVGLLIRLVATLAALGIGLGILWAVPERSLAAGAALRRSPFRSLAWGVGVASVPVALVIVSFGIVSVTSLSSSGPLIAVLIPVALALATVVGLALFTTPVPVALALGGAVRPAWSSYARYVAGFGLMVVGWLLPFVGGAILAVLALGGLGAWLVADEPQSDEDPETDISG